jgi:hypothetical protein
MGIADRRRKQVLDAVQPHLEPGEEVHANLPSSQTGPSPWFYAITYLIAFWIRQLGVVVTNKRVFFVKRGTFTNQVKGVEAVFALDDVHVVDWKSAALWSTLRVQRPDGELKLNVHRMHRDDAEQLAHVLAGQQADAA